MYPHICQYFIYGFLTPFQNRTEMLVVSPYTCTSQLKCNMKKQLICFLSWYSFSFRYSNLDLSVFLRYFPFLHSGSVYFIFPLFPTFLFVGYLVYVRKRRRQRYSIRQQGSELWNSPSLPNAISHAQIDIDIRSLRPLYPQSRCYPRLFT